MQLIETEIDAPIELVRGVPTDREWIFYITAASGNLRKGADAVLQIDHVHRYHGSPWKNRSSSAQPRRVAS